MSLKAVFKALKLHRDKVNLSSEIPTVVVCSEILTAAVVSERLQQEDLPLSEFLINADRKRKRRQKAAAIQTNHWLSLSRWSFKNSKINRCQARLKTSVLRIKCAPCSSRSTLTGASFLSASSTICTSESSLIYSSASWTSSLQKQAPNSYQVVAVNLRNAFASGWKRNHSLPDSVSSILPSLRK